MVLLFFSPSFTFLSFTFLFNLFCISSLCQRVVLLNFLDIKVNPNSLLFSQRERERERERESSKSSREGDGAMVLCKLSVLGHPTNLDNSMVRAYCACSRCGWVFFFNIFSLYLFSFLPPSLGHDTEILSQRAVKPKITNQPNPVLSGMRTPVFSCYHAYSKVLDKNACRSTDSDLTTYSTILNSISRRFVVL